MAETPTIPTPLATAPVKNPELGELLRLMHVVDVERQKRDLALEELSADEQKRRLRQELEKVYTAEGANVSRTEIDAAIEAHYADRYLFKPPSRTLAYRIARMYIARFWIFTRLVLPLLVIFGIVLTIVSVISAQIHTRHLAEERAVEQSVLGFYNAVNAAHAGLALAKVNLARHNEPNAAVTLDQVRTTLQHGADRLHLADQFLLKYCPNGDPKSAVTLGNLPEVRTGLASQQSALDEVQQSLQNAKSGLGKMDELLAVS